MSAAMPDLSIYAKGAQLERQLRQIKPGERFRIPAQELAEIQVPANPLDRQTVLYLSDWFRDRMPFYCVTYHNIATGDIEFANEQSSAGKGE
jgi:hypothetical protein